MTIILGGSEEMYSSQHIFRQCTGTGLPAVEAIVFGSYIVMRNWNVLHCVQPKPILNINGGAGGAAYAV